MQLTHVGGPTVLIEVAGWRILTDPTFDAPGRKYGFGWGTSSTKTVGPAVRPDDLGQVDLVLLSHDQHADNLDDLGRRELAAVPRVLTTVSGARRLGGGATGMKAWDTVRIDQPGKPSLVTATPCRHGPPLSRPIVGDVVGFSVQAEDWQRSLWMSGDTVFYRGIREVADRLDVHTALVHLGRVRFPITGPLKYSMDGRDLIRTIELLGPEVAVPAHFEGWSHFTQQESALRDALDGAPAGVASRLRWLDPGTAMELTDPD